MRIIPALVVALAVIALPTLQAYAMPSVVRLFNTGCKVAKSPAHGCFFTNVRGPIAPGPLGQGTKEGKACGYNILALFTWGDVRITTAMKNGGITEISSIDHDTFELIPGIYGYSRYCTVVTGE